MSNYEIGGARISGDHPQFSDVLAKSQSNKKQRPLCLCRIPGIEMYIAKVAGKCIIKRMPGTGDSHSPTCDSYEPPPELSGLGQVLGTAIQENTESGITTLKFDFSLSKVAGRTAPVPSGGESDTVKTDGNKLTLRGTLHYLWEQAGMNKWTPAMAGKRSWYVVRKYILQATDDKASKGSNLGDLLYIPETFHADKKNEITQRRIAHMMKVSTQVGGTRQLMIAIGEVKEITEARYGFKIIFKHLPDCHFMLNDDLHKRLQKRFATEMELWNSLSDSHLIAICTFGVSSTGTTNIEELALMTVNENWIPFENSYEKMVLDSMTQANRRFIKGVRYNLATTRPLACLVTSDTKPEPTAMYIVPPGATEDYTKSLNALIEESKLACWKWVVSEHEMPPLPSLNQAQPQAQEPTFEE